MSDREIPDAAGVCARWADQTEELGIGNAIRGVLEENERLKAEVNALKEDRIKVVAAQRETIIDYKARIDAGDARIEELEEENAEYILTLLALHFERDRANRRGDKIRAALALHTRLDSHGYCTECSDATHWECDTVKALRG